MSIANHPLPLQVDPIGRLVADPEARHNADYWRRMHSAPATLHGRLDEDHEDAAEVFASEHLSRVIAPLVRVEDASHRTQRGNVRAIEAVLDYQTIVVEVVGVTPIYPRLSGAVEGSDLHWTAALDCVWSADGRMFAAYTIEQEA